MALLEIKNLAVSADGKQILQGVNLAVQAGEVMALMGPNGSGKSTLAHILMGHPEYVVTGGSVMYDGQDLLAMKPEERAKLGLFLSFQQPQTIAGVSVGNFLRLAYQARFDKQISVADFLKLLTATMAELKMPKEWMLRNVNVGFSGGEKKRLEMLQLAMLQPRLAILDETDSGLDVDALRAVGEGLAVLRQRRPEMSLLVITHYKRLLDYLPVDSVAVMKNGLIEQTGAADLVQNIEAHGFGAV
jgi:Fe-S cluster assembly ATP-binding protein